MSKPSGKDAARSAPDLETPGLPGEARLDVTAIPAEYWRAFSIVSFTMNRFIVDHVFRAARQFDNDIEAMILLGTLAHLNVAHLMLPGASPSDSLSRDGRLPDAQPRLRPVRVRDLAQITGRPRETVRRKIERLIAEGRVLRVVGGYVLDVDSVDEPMRIQALDSVRRFMEAARVIGAALDDARRTLTRDQGPAVLPSAGS